MVPIAIVAGLFVPGLGQIVQGHARRGAIVQLVVLSAVLACAVTVLALPALLVLHLAGIVDAVRLEHRAIRWPFAIGALACWSLGLLGVKHGVLLVVRVSASASMVPTLAAGDVVAVHRTTTVERGDVVVFGLPCDPQREYVKRVVARAGQSVEVRCRVLYVDGAPLDGDGGADFPDLAAVEAPGCSSSVVVRGELVPAVPLDAMASDPCALQRRYVVPRDMVFVVGDNRGGSHDSRAFGGVPLTYLRGRVTGVIWPPASFGKVR